MVFSVSPSVTVREVDASAVIPAVATPPAAFVGVFRWGPTNERILITSEDELVQRFGKPYSVTTGDSPWTNAETFFTAADFLSYSNALYVTRVVSDTAARAVSSYFEALYEGELGNSIQVAMASSTTHSVDMTEIGDMTGTFEFNSQTLTFTTTTEIPSSNRPQPGDVVRIGNNNTGFQDIVVEAFDDDSATEAPFGYSIDIVTNYTLAEDDAALLQIEKRWGYANFVSGAPTAADRVHISVTDVDGVITGTPNTILEMFENVSVNENAKLEDGTSNYYVNVIANRSQYIRAIGTDAGVGDNIPENPIMTTFTGSVYDKLGFGSDGDGEASIAFGRLAQGYDLYKDASEVDVSLIMCGKSSNANLANYVTQNIAEDRKDCVVFVSPPYASAVSPASAQAKMNEIINFRNQLTASSYLFIDTGYKYRYDKYNDAYRWVPLNGDMAGLTARVEPFESPAGFRKGVVKNVVKLAFNPNKVQRDQLYGKDVNPVISQVGQGVVLFGDKTALGTATGSAFTRINVRRLFIAVEKVIATASASFLFEFNDDFTQTQFRNLIEPFLRDIQGKRGIIDFRVVSDSSINTPDIIDRNMFRGNIFIKPARSINIIELTFVATRTGVEFEELVGQPL